MDVVGIAVGVSIAAFILFIVCPITICLIVWCCIVYGASRPHYHRVTTVVAAPAAPSATVVATSNTSQTTAPSTYPPPPAYTYNPAPPTYPLQQPVQNSFTKSA